ncbi:MAG: ABC transporter ATP-binding protein [Motilibacteraceae bacterium]
MDRFGPPAVRVQDVSIHYRTTFERVPTFKTALVRFGRGERAVRTVEAVKHVSFDVHDGTSIGIIGANGAGKSTLMRAVAGILPPTEGRIEVRGRISTLLALGVGFNASLSGRENVVLGGLASGLSRREVNERADEIADFAEIGDFMDAPMSTYSSGMFSRLAFSVAVHMEPDILLIDEALSAGDASFKKKAAAKMNELMQSARAMFLVSHALQSVKDLCNDAIWLHKGELMMRGKPEEVIAAYSKFLQVGEEAFSLEDL